MAEQKKETKKANTTQKKNQSKKAHANKTTAKGSNKSSMGMEIGVIAVFGVTILLFLSNFHICGKVGDLFSKGMFGLTGMLAYIFPIIIFGSVLFLIANRGNVIAYKRYTYFVLLYWCICAVLQLMFYPFSENTKILQSFAICASNRFGGGFFGALLGYGLAQLFGMVGTFIILILLMAILFVVLSGKSLIAPVSKGSKQLYDSAKKNMDRRKELNEIRKEDRREERRIKQIERDARKDAEIEYERDLLAKKKAAPIDLSTIPEDRSVVKYEEKKVPVERIKRLFSTTGDVTEVDHTVEKEENKNHQNQSHVQEEVVSEFIDTREEDQPKHYEVEDVFDELDMVIHPEDEVLDEANEELQHEESDAIEEIESFFNEPSEKKKKETSAETIKTDVTKEAAEIAHTVSEEKVMEYKKPPLSLLQRGSTGSEALSDTADITARKLEDILRNFGVNVTVTDVAQGPSVTRYELQLELGTKVSKITSLTDDIKLNLAASDIRIEAPIPGKAAVGIEVPNACRKTVYLRELIESEELANHPSKIAFAAGKDIAGKVVVADIAKMPHMLVAGTTGSGKSVFTNSIIMSILFRATPEEVRMIIVDPKVVEFGVYNGIPHLLIPVVTDPKKAAGALSWAVAEMSSRYKKFAEWNVRDLKGYNAKIKTAPPVEGEEPLKPLPQIVIIIDELADLMMVAAKEVEESICRLAQLARACGIHLIIATQRPSVDVVTGLIKANIPSRAALLVSSGVDSRTIIDMNGAEKLLGNGDMLFAPANYAKPVRVQGAFVSDEEVQNVVSFLTNHENEVSYNEEITLSMESAVKEQTEVENDDERDVYFLDAARFVIEKEKASVSMLQRRFKIGFNRAARVVDQLAEAGIVGEEEGTKPRKVLLTIEELEEKFGNGSKV